MNFAEYIEKSSVWLVDTAFIFDLAESTRKALRPGYQLPPESDTGDWQEAPYLGSGYGREALQQALPLMLKTSPALAWSVELVKGPEYKGSSTGRTQVNMTVNEPPRVEAVMARLGIISQFELWKKLAVAAKYPINKKQADIFSFKTPEERECLEYLVDIRNKQTHEVDVETDTTMKKLVEYTYHCRWLAEKIVTYT